MTGAARRHDRLATAFAALGMRTFTWAVDNFVSFVVAHGRDLALAARQDETIASAVAAEVGG